MAVLVKHLDVNKIRDLRQAFVYMDTSNSGALTADEIRKALLSQGEHPAGTEIEAIIENCDH
jgi:Ca2+-binding EF-hand superfamily protein